MANEHRNELRIASDRERVDASVAAMRVGDDHFSPAVDVPGLPDGFDLAMSVDEPVRSESNGLAVAEYSLVTRGGAPWALAEALASEADGFAVSLATVEPGNRIAEVRLHAGDAHWSYEVSDEDYDRIEETAEADGEDLETLLLDDLASTSASVVDDHERLVAGTSPTP